MGKQPESDASSKAAAEIAAMMRPGSGSTAIALVLGLVGAALGGAVGYWAFGWCKQQGFYALVLPGALLGLGFGLAARKSHFGFGLISGLLALVLGLICEWKYFNSDESLFPFLKQLDQLQPVTWIMIAIGSALAFSFGKGRPR